MERVCAACGTAGTGRFCGDCGAPLLQEPLAVGRALRAEAADVLGFDRRLIATVRDLLMHPVRIVTACMSGDRRMYLPPLKLFLALAGLYMLGLSIVQPYDFDPAGMRTMGVDQAAAARIDARIRKSGMNVDLFTDRFQARMNAVVPVVTALALLPMVVMLKLLNRSGAWSEHLMFLLVASNGIWLVSLLLLPIAFANVRLHQIVALIVLYGYLGWVFFALYRARTRLGTSARFAVFLVVDLLLSVALSAVLFWIVYESVFLI
jgi:Protein of unknown function (DUF3667)